MENIKKGQESLYFLLENLGSEMLRLTKKVEITVSYKTFRSLEERVDKLEMTFDGRIN
ncbi:MAG: hypothetical protein WC570_01045 [Patescibacteria group bacterium]